MVVMHERGAESAPTKKADKRGKQKQAERVTEEAVAVPSEPVSERSQESEPATQPAARRGTKAQAGASITMAELAQRYLEHLEAVGKSHGTLFSYGMEIRTACRELGGDTLIASLTPEQVLVYFEGPRVTQLKSGRPKAKPSIDKTRRVLRLALVWAVEQGWIEKAPLPQTPEPAQ